MKNAQEFSGDIGVTRRNFIRGGAGAMAAISFLHPSSLYAGTNVLRDIQDTTSNQKPDAKRSATTISAGEAVTLHSTILGEDRTVFVSVPASYSRNVRAYPVLYLTDAQWNFSHTQTTAALLARNWIIPEMIIVGVTNLDRTHDLYATRADFKRAGQTIPFPTSGNADRFLEFFEKELISWTEATYRTTPLRILAGHSAGGNFALHTMRMKPGLFQAIIATSPWLAWDDRKELNAILSFLASANLPLRALFFSYADEGAEMKANIDALAKALRSRNFPNLRWNSAAYPTETHDSTVIKSYYDALRMIFGGWSYPRDLRTNLLKGSLNDLKTHYHNFGQQLGVVMLPPEAITNELGYQYLSTNNISEALATFRFNAENYPRSANVWDSLGEALEKAGRSEEALASYQKAVAAAEPNGDRNLESFRKKVIRLSESLKPKVK